MSRSSRSTRNARDSYNFDGIVDPSQVSEDDIRMQQALLEAVGRVQTPTSPSVGRSSRRTSSHPPTYGPAQPNVREDAVLYDPTAWGAISEGSSERRRLSSKTQGPGAARYSPTSTAYSPRSRPQRQQQQYDPSSPLYARSPRLYDPSDPGRSPTAGGESSPGYIPQGPYGGNASYGRYGNDQPPASIGYSQRSVNGVMEALEYYQRQVNSRMDRIEAQLAAISDLLAEHIEAQQAGEDTSSRRNKRKRNSDKRVSFDTSGHDSGIPTTPSKKPKIAPKKALAPRTPPKQQAADQPKTPGAPRKAVPKRSESQRPKPSKKPSAKSTPVTSEVSANEAVASVPEAGGALRRSARVRKRAGGD